MGSHERRCTRKKPRNRLSIIYDVLVCCRGKNLLISEVARKANVSSVFMGGLVEAGFLVKKVVGKRTVYSTSGLGCDFMRRYDNLLAIDDPRYPALQELASLKSHVL